MPVRNLDVFFRPASLALVGPAVLDRRALDVLVTRLAESMARVPVSLVALGDMPAPPGMVCHDRLDDMQTAPDLALLACGPEAGLAALAGLVKGGTRGALILSDGDDLWPPEAIRAAQALARPAALRLIGPGSLGFSLPGRGFNPHLAAGAVPKGDLALVSRSSAMINAILAWSRGQGIGFSAVVSLGQKADVDVGDMLDHLAQDAATKAVLVHLEDVAAPAKFLSAARAIARVKPVIVIRTGFARHNEAASALAALARPDAVLEAAFRRAGLLCVDTFDDLVTAAEIVTRVKPVAATRVAVLANGASLAALAGDHLDGHGGEAPDISEATGATLAPLLRPGLDSGSAFILSGAAPPESHGAALAALLADPGVDAAIVLHAPHVLSDGPAIAAALIAATGDARRRQGRMKPVITAFLDGDDGARRVLEAAGLPVYATPEAAVRAWSFLTRFAEAQAHLTAIPAMAPPRRAGTREAARALLASPAAPGSTVPAATAAALLKLYDLDIAPAPDRAADLLVGIVDDAVFGPVVVLAAGQNGLERQATRGLDLVPLDANLAGGLVERVGFAALLHGQPVPLAARQALAQIAVHLSDLAADLPDLGDIALNVRITAEGVALENPVLRRAVSRGRGGRLGHPRLAIRPYPRDWERRLALTDGETFVVRPIRPEDEALYPDFLAQVTAEDLRLRFFAPIKEFTHAFLARLTQLDYARAMAFAALGEDGAIRGIVRLHADPDHHTGEYAILLRSDMKGRGLGRALMRLIIDWAVADGIAVVKGEVLRSNGAMLGMCRDLGFDVHSSPDDDSIAEVTLETAKLRPLAGEPGGPA